MNKKDQFLIGLVILLVLILGAEAVLIIKKLPKGNEANYNPIVIKPQDKTNDNPVVKDENGKVTLSTSDFKGNALATFATEAEFKEYLKKMDDSNFSYYGGGMMVRTPMMTTQDMALGFNEIGGATSLGAKESFGTAPSAGMMDGVATIDRFSSTNVQVAGIDEPDIVKTDGKNVYYSLKDQRIYYYMRDSGNNNVNSDTKIINSLPVKDLKVQGKIDKVGDLLLKDNMLAVITQYPFNVYGYDVTKSNEPAKKWELDMSQDVQIESSRLYGNDLYLVTALYINSGSPCPIRPMSIDSKEMIIPCTDIYRPDVVIPAETTYTVFKIDMKDGTVKQKLSFVGNRSNTVIYMSSENLYVTYSNPKDPFEAIVGFIDANLDVFPAEIADKIKKLKDYDISSRSKMSELEIIMDKLASGMTPDDRLKFENEFENRVSSYSDKIVRQIEKTGVVKIKIADLTIEKTANFPGRLLNQFAMDEYNGNLRVATTTGGSNGGMWSSAKSVNDVYVLDKDLGFLGSVLNMGENERIYSVRFLGDKGYVVTFRQTDPFYVLDLSNPAKPEKKGELKIPGYSSYLHPLETNKILGVGEEDNQVKLSVFDVSDPSNPIEMENYKYKLKEYWTDVANNHHAYLQDDKYKIFFLPASTGGYIFSYDGSLKMVKAISEPEVKRAIFVNDFMYVLTGSKMLVYDEKNWEKVGQLDF